MAQTKAQQSHISLKIDELFTAAQNSNYETAIKLILLEKKNNDNLDLLVPDIENSSDLNKVKRICRKMDALRKVSDQYLIDEFAEENYQGQNVFAITLLFKSGDQTISKLLRFVLLEKEFYLIKID